MENESRNNIPAIVSAVILGIGIVVAAFAGIVYPNRGYNRSKSEYEDQIRQLQEQLAGFNETESTADPVDVEAMVHSASADGQELADLEMEFVNLTDKYVHAEDAAAQDAARESFVEVQSLMREYLGESSAYASAWYLGDSSLVSYEWQFESNFDFNDTSVPVLWTCRKSDDPDVILAYVMGDYNSKERKFVNMGTAVTSEGAMYYSVTHPEGADVSTFDPDTYGNDILEMASQIHADVIEPDNVYSAEELTEMQPNMDARYEVSQEAWGKGGNE